MNNTIPVVEWSYGTYGTDPSGDHWLRLSGGALCKLATRDRLLIYTSDELTNENVVAVIDPTVAKEFNLS